MDHVRNVKLMYSAISYFSILHFVDTVESLPYLPAPLKWLFLPLNFVPEDLICNVHILLFVNIFGEEALEYFLCSLVLHSKIAYRHPVLILFL